MKCICDFEAFSLRNLRSHFSTFHKNMDFLVIFSNEIEREWKDVGKGTKRIYLLRKANYKCTRCGFNETRSCGATILEIDHIDGNHQNDELSNLRVLCPNCHALTPKYRNWSNTGNKKTSETLRPGNTGYNERKELNRQKREEREKVVETRRVEKKQFENRKADEALSKLKEMKAQFEENFKKEILILHETGEIDFSKYGWVQLLSERFEEIPQVVGRRVRRLMPDFYIKHCYSRHYNFYKKEN
jgi:hypothetical protein